MRESGPAGAVDLRTRVGSVTLENPVMTASGTSGHGAELAAIWTSPASARGGQVPVGGGLGWQPGAAVGPPRDRRRDAQQRGLQNPGVERWLASELPALARTGARVVASIWGFTADRYGQAARSIADAIRDVAPGSSPAGAIVAVEANISCPNIEDRRRMFAHSAAVSHEPSGPRSTASAGRALWAKIART